LCKRWENLLITIKSSFWSFQGCGRSRLPRSCLPPCKVYSTGVHDGFLSLTRYQVGLQVILEKKAGNIYVDNIWAILLMEGNFKTTMKISIGSCMIKNALSNISILAESYGSQPECTAIQVLLNQEIMANITGQAWMTLAVVKADCLTCYNSIPYPLALIACQHLDMPPSVLEMIFSRIKNMHIFLHTAHGDSTTFYGGQLSFVHCPYGYPSLRLPHTPLTTTSTPPLVTWCLPTHCLDFLPLNSQ